MKTLDINIHDFMDVLPHSSFQMLTSVFLVKNQMNIFILLTTVTLTPTVQTPKDHSTARVIRDTLEMESRVSVYSYIRFYVFNQFDRYAPEMLSASAGASVGTAVCKSVTSIHDPLVSLHRHQ